MTLFAATWGAGQVAFDLLWFFLFLVEIWLMFTIFVDIFRSHDLPGWQKALWVIFVLALPLIGILAYLIVRGGQMRAHQAQGSHWYQTAGPGSPPGSVGRAAPTRSAHDTIDSLHRLTDLRDRGEITADEYQGLRDQLLAEPDSPPEARNQI